MSHPAPTPVSQRTALAILLKHLWIPLYMGLAMTMAYLGAFHQAVPNHVQVAIVAPTAQGQALARQVQAAAGSQFDVRTVATAAQGRAGVSDGTLSASFTPGSAATAARGADPVLVIDTAASPTTASAVTTAFNQVAGASDQRLAITDLGPLPAYDSLGQNTFFLMVGVTIGSYTLAATMGAAGALLSFRRKAGVIVPAAGVIAALSVIVADPVIGAVRGHAWQLFLLSWLYAAAVALMGTSFHTFFKKAATPALVTVFVALNFTTSGGVFAPALQYGFFRALSHVWIGTGYMYSGQSILYRTGAGLSGDLFRIVWWLVAAAVLFGAAALIERRRHAAQPVPAQADIDEEEALSGAVA